MDFYSASLLKQRSADWHVTPLGHIQITGHGIRRATAVAWNNQISKYIISNYVNILEDSQSFYNFFFGKAPSNYISGTKKRNYICDMNKSNTIFSETCLNRTLNKPKTCLNQTDLTVQSTQCLCNLNLCKPNTCLNWFIIGSIVFCFFLEISKNHTFLETEGVGEWLLFNAKWTIFQLYHGKNMLNSMKW